MYYGRAYVSGARARAAKALWSGIVHMGCREIYGRKIYADVGIERKLIHTLSL